MTEQQFEEICDLLKYIRNGVALTFIAAIAIFISSINH